MTITVTSPITGSAQTGLTSPTYTNVTDSPPGGLIGKQVAVTALGGTQTGVTVHSVAAPFVIDFIRPSVLKTLSNPNPVTGVIANVPMNVYKAVTIKGVLPLAGQPYKNMVITTTFSVPAGADLADPANVRAAVSAHIGALTQQSAGLGDLLVNGVL